MKVPCNDVVANDTNAMANDIRRNLQTGTGLILFLLTEA